MAMAMADATQKLIYASPARSNVPLNCAASNAGAIPNSDSVLVELPVYLLEALSEISSSLASWELAFSMSWQCEELNAIWLRDNWCSWRCDEHRHQSFVGEPSDAMGMNIFDSYYGSGNTFILCYEEDGFLEQFSRDSHINFVRSVR
ncbi:peptide transporter ptr2 [Conoideocrella luteorostrata]|uniref:Peptide transporter ptr2 n=1 Tax=Conoideocrella luteorostrata TaxID=1105319 RepID=A0AAJ0CQM5_9HYPO|nr:peptide transporter ptr2 [Conoideocrella luteorostrata]